jgi:hypothetical protein
MISFASVCILSLVGHAIGDYVLQTDFLAKAKNPSFWKDRSSWPFVLIGHCLIWGGCVFAPMFAYCGWDPGVCMTSVFAVSVAAHFFADWLKCLGKTNLMEDQLFHYAQIAIALTALWFVA